MSRRALDIPQPVRDLVNAAKRAKRAGHPVTSDMREAVREYQRLWLRQTPKYRLLEKKHWRHANPLRAQEHHLRHCFGITAGQYGALFAAQGGVCAICGRPPVGKRLAVDHNHETGAVRGLLCSNCNRALGLLQDDESVVASAARYLAAREAPVAALPAPAGTTLEALPLETQP